MSPTLPPDENARLGAAMARLAAIMARLRDPDTGCPWDLAQDPASLAPHAIEEAHEVADAIARKAWEELPGELGDLLLQVVFQSRIAEEEGRFDLADVADRIAEKLIARHPQIFGDAQPATTPEEQTRAWEAIKAAERANSGDKGVLDGVALGLPALMRATKLQNRAARVGFDWPDATAMLDKITEETAELVAARKSGDQADIAEEYGDLLFAMVNLARHLDIDPESALRDANAKFTRRFRQIEAALAADNRHPSDADARELNRLWDEAKAKERR